jgi:ketosteroid isomerase-like protein
VSQENVETVRRAVEAWNGDDLDAFLAELDPDVEWHPAIEPGIEGKATIYRGADGARKIWRQDRGDAWERLVNRPEELRDLGDSVLALGHLDLTARSTGIEFSQEVGEVFDLRAGKIVRIRDFLTHAEALEAAGQGNVDTLRRALEAFNRGDRAAWLEMCDPLLENVPPREWPESNRVLGRELAWDFFTAATEPWEDSPLEHGEIVDGGSVVAAEVRGSVRGRASGAGVPWGFWQVVRFRDGRMIHFSWFADRAEALEAAGVSG